MKNKFAIVSLGSAARIHTSRMNADDNQACMYLGNSPISVLITRREAARVIREARRDSAIYSTMADLKPVRTVFDRR
jgi:hypothetical protein